MKKILLAFLVLTVSSLSYGKCYEVDGSKKSEFNGKNLSGFQIEKKSLNKLESAFPDLKAKEKMFSGEITVCTDCSSKHIICD